MQQVASNRPQPVLGDKRFEGGAARFARCARLLLAFGVCTRVAAGSGVCVLDSRLTTLRNPNFKALWGTLFRVSPEVVSTVVATTWHADVVAIVVASPW